MNIKKWITEKWSKVLCVALVISLIFNGVMWYTLVQMESQVKDTISAEYEEEIADKDNTITRLQNKITNLERDYTTADNDTENEDNTNDESSDNPEMPTEQTETTSKVDIDSESSAEENDNQILAVSESFIGAYLNYSSDSESLSARRKALSDIVSSDELLNILAPEESNETESVIDAEYITYTSKINSADFYVYSESNNNSAKVMIEVTYTVNSYEGETELHAICTIKLTTDDSGNYKIADYNYQNIS